MESWGFSQQSGTDSLTFFSERVTEQIPLFFLINRKKTAFALSLFIFYPFWCVPTFLLGASLVAQRVKHLPTMREIRVWPLGQEDPLEKEMATHSSTLVWKIPGTEKPGRLQSMGLQRVRHDYVTSLSLHLFIKPSWSMTYQFYLLVLYFLCKRW